MLPNAVLNHMDVHDLRNYLVKLQAVEETHGDMVFAKDEVIELLQRLYGSRIHMEEARVCHDVKIGSLRAVERDYCEKYKQYMPEPVCSEPPVYGQAFSPD